MVRIMNELKLFNLYLEQGFKLIKCKGYNSECNPYTKGTTAEEKLKAYDTAKQPIDRGYTKEDFTGVSPEEATLWLKYGGWLGCLIPKGYIALDVVDFRNEYFESICRQLGIDPSIHKTPNGKFYLFQLKHDLKAATQVHTKSGIELTYRVGGKNYIILAPVPSREWELLLPLNELPGLPTAFYPYDRRDKNDVLICLSWELGDAWRDGLLDEWVDIDATYIGLLIDCYFSEYKIHDAFKIMYLEDYDADWTHYHYRRIKERLQGGDTEIWAGRFLREIRNDGLKKIEMFTELLLRA